MLRHEVLAIHDLPVDLVAELILQCVKDDLECATTVMRGEVLYVLQEERGRTLSGDDARHVEEQSALSLVTETGLPPKTALLGHTGQTERLARESGKHHVAVRDVIRVHLRDVSSHDLGEPVIGAIGTGGELVPLGREHGVTTGRREAAADATDSGEQVDGAEVRTGLVCGAVVQLLQRGNVGGLALNLARFPALHGGRGQTKRFGQLAPGHTLTQLGDQLVGIINGILRCHIAHRDECTS